MDWTFPYPSQRMPVLAQQIVATSQPLAAQAGLQVMLAGGNAADAAVATAICLTVVEPTSNGIGSDSFALIWDGAALHGLNASGRAPRAMDGSRFHGMREMPVVGWDPVTVPGCVSAWAAVSAKFGRVPFANLFESAIRYAREGYLVSPLTAGHWNAAVTRWGHLPAFAATFLPGGKAPRAGERIVLPDHARTLEEIASTRGESFYRGSLAQRIAAAAREAGAPMTEGDMAAHRCDWVTPIAIEYHGWTLHEIGPNGQGIAALMALGMLRHHDLASLHPDCPDALHLQIEAMKLAFADVHEHVGDPAFMRVSSEDLLDESYLARRAKRIDPSRAQDFGSGEPKKGGTVLLCAADQGGMMVSFIQSNYTGFGSGIVIPGAGISMQNRGACFTPKAGHVNAPEGGKRPYHTIIPGFVTREGKPFMAFGVMGGPMQPQGHVQVILRMADHAMNPQSAIDAPRWQVMGGQRVDIEPGFAADVYETLRARGHDLRLAESRNVAFGGGQAILRLDHGYCGASDPRRDGGAVGV